LYGAPAELRTESGKRRAAGAPATLALDRNFLHSAKLELIHPRTGEQLGFTRELPGELATFLCKLEDASLERPSRT